MPNCMRNRHIVYSAYGGGGGGGGGSNSIFVCRFCEHFAKNRGWTDINVHKNAHKILTFQPVQTKRGVSQVFKSIPNHSLCDLHTILNEHTSIISIQEPSKSAKNNFCLFLSIFVCRFCEHFAKIRG